MEMVPFPFDLILCIFHNPIPQEDSFSFSLDSFLYQKNPTLHPKLIKQNENKKDSQMPPNKYKMNLPPTPDRQNKNIVTHTCNSFLDIQTHFFVMRQRERWI
ncbi:hypothetical protein ACKWTF_006519 [Chironomus riparius]